MTGAKLSCNEAEGAAWIGMIPGCWARDDADASVVNSENKHDNNDLVVLAAITFKVFMLTPPFIKDGKHGCLHHPVVNYCFLGEHIIKPWMQAKVHPAEGIKLK